MAARTFAVTLSGRATASIEASMAVRSASEGVPLGEATVTVTTPVLEEGETEIRLMLTGLPSSSVATRTA
jgi:hypothetical protein